MSTSNPLIIEVRANEFADKSNPNVPWTIDEIVRDAAQCAAAGAAVYHWHTVTDAGEAAIDDIDRTAAISTRIRADADVLLHATLGFTDTQGDPSSRVRTLRALRDAHARPDLIPIDIGAIVADTWDAQQRRFRTDDQILLNTTGYLRELGAGVARLGLGVEAVLWSPGAARTAQRLRDEGHLAVPVFWQLGFTGDQVPGGMPATERQLDAYLEALPPGEPWNIHVRDGDGLSLAVHAMQRGGHVAIGLGDDAYARLGLPSNVELVRRLADVAATIGRPVATVDKARSILGLHDRDGAA